MAKITDPDSLVVGTEITFDLPNKTFTLIEAGNLVAKDGVTGNALWAKFVDLWTSDTYQPYPFPMNVLDARSGQYIFGQDPGGTYNGWKPANDTTRQMIRDAGWSEYSGAGVLNRQYVGMVALASGFPTGAQFYYQKDSTESGVDFTYDDAPNEAIQVYGDASNGDFDDRTFFKLFCREENYLYDDAVLGDVGESGTGAYKVALPIAVGADLDIQDDDDFVSLSLTVSAASWSGGIATITTSASHGLTTGQRVSITGVSPIGYNVVGDITEKDADEFYIDIASDPGTYSTGGAVKAFYDTIKVRYFTGAFTKDVESSTGRDFGIVIDAGTHSGIDGSAPGGASVLTTAAGGLTVDAWIGGTLEIYEGTDEGTVFPITDNDATTVTVTGTIASGSNMSFTLFPPSKRDPVADLQEIYTKVQYLLRQDSNINSASGTVNGKTAALLLNFVGSSLKCGFYIPTNPQAGGTGVIVQGLRDADINSIVFYDNTEASREYPYASAGTINSNAVLTSGGTGYYRMYFTTLPGAGNDYGESGAVTVNDADGNPITGAITGASLSFTFDYSNNVQGGRTAGTDAAVTVVAGNPGSAKPVVATGTITASKSIVITLTAETDRAYIA